MDVTACISTKLTNYLGQRKCHVLDSVHVSSLLPSHGFPPFKGPLHVLSRVGSHVPQGPHGPNPFSSTANNEKRES